MATHPDVDPSPTFPGDGDRAALNALVPLVYEELRDLARRQLRRFRPDQTLNTTALVHEAYLKLADGARASFRDRGHFYAVAATAMRQLVVDYARRRRAQKRGGAAPHRPLEDGDGSERSAESEAAKLVALDEALVRLGTIDDRLVRVVELRFFGGLSVEETAAVLAVSTATVKRDTRLARAYLHRELTA